MGPAAGLRPALQPASQPSATKKLQQPKSRTSVLDNSQDYQLGGNEHNLSQSSVPEMNDAENKVLAFEHEIYIDKIKW